MDDIDDLLIQYRPAGPPADLRARIVEAVDVHAGRRRRMLLEWLPPAAAAAAVILFHMLSARVGADLSIRLSAIDRARETIVADLALRLGGDTVARRAAEQLIEADERAAAMVPIDPMDQNDVRATNHD